MAMSEIRWIETFAGNLRSLLDETGMSQRELARESGVSEVTISKYLHGSCMPSVAALVNIYHVFYQRVNVAPYDLFYFYDKLELRPSRR